MGRPATTKKPDDFAARVGQTIRRRREKIKLTVEEAATTAGLSAPAWYHIECGRHLKLQRLPAIAAALRCRVRDLIPAGE